ncbi:MAG: type III pantothenate kinase [Gemmatimonadota bacterium]|nr:type III pantothenate kinase [Gemmatimonadota bacterium]
MTTPDLRPFQPLDLVFDVGNTETVAGLFDGDRIIAHWRFASDPRRTADEQGVLLLQLLHAGGRDERRVRSLTIGSVVPALNEILATAGTRYLGLQPRFIDARTPLPIRLDVEDPLTVGADRVLNTLAASHLYAADTVVVDLGTATTFDCVSAEGAFIGGVIAPGVRNAAEQLTSRTAKLPRVELRAPPRVIGRRTEQCLQSGIFWGAVDAIDGMVRRIRVEWERPAARVVATGGLAELIGPHCATVDAVEPFLTLQGLRLAREHLEREAHPASAPEALLPG